MEQVINRGIFRDAPPILENKMSNSFDLETKMMECWRVVDDIKFIYEEFHDGVSSMSRDQMANLLLGMEEMYDRKFERLWDEFEKVFGHGCIFLSESEVLLCKQHREYGKRLDEMFEGHPSYNEDELHYGERAFGVNINTTIRKNT